jgi:sugar transferase EpsL
LISKNATKNRNVKKGYNLKRLLDCFISLITLVVLLPTLVALTILISQKFGAPVLFKQERPGLHGKTFFVYKFRSMTDEKDADGELLPDNVRLTSFGKVIRKLSLDELPQLWNVFKGDMSFVGPRPLLVEYLPLYNKRQAKRHNVRPGITGWAQVNGRNTISWKEKFELDVWYVENQSFWLDMKILFMTVKKVFTSEGISQEGQATMTKFEGKKN